jgi:ubiquinone/menaquinone biosynthesis C-methylase UbiE
MAKDHPEFWSKVSPKYDQVVDLQIGPRTRAMVQERVAREGSLGRLVEFGCGTGFYTQVLAERASTVVATDVSPGMLEAAKRRVQATNVAFQIEDCQKTSLPEGAFDTAFLSLVLHFTEPEQTLSEMRRLLRAGGTLIIANLDPQALAGLDRVRSLMRVLYRGFVGYRTKPPKGFGRNLVTEKRLRELLDRSGFRVGSSETIRDPSRSSNIPIEYVRAVKA